MANVLAYAMETIQKIGVTASGKGKMMKRKLGRIDNIEKEVAERIGRETGEKLRNIDLKQTARRENARKYKEARNPTPAAAAAIEEPVTSYNYRQTMVDGKETYQRKPVGADDSTYSNIDVREYRDARKNSHSKTAEFIYESPSGSSDNLPAVIADEISKSGAGFWDGIPGWVKGVGIGTAGIIAGGIIFDDDDE